MLQSATADNRYDSAVGYHCLRMLSIFLSSQLLHPMGEFSSECLNTTGSSLAWIVDVLVVPARTLE